MRNNVCVWSLSGFIKKILDDSIFVVKSTGKSIITLKKLLLIGHAIDKQKYDIDTTFFSGKEKLRVVLPSQFTRDDGPLEFLLGQGAVFPFGK